MISYKEAIKTRRSVRTYNTKALDRDTILKIMSLLENPEIGPYGNKPRFVLIDKPEARKNYKVKLGTYGFISNASYFIGGSIEKFDYSEVDYGYSLEKIIIELTRMGLATCWLGGSFNRKDYEVLLNTTSEEIIPCITPVGYKAQNLALKDRLTLKITGGPKRKPFETLFFENNIDTPLEYNRKHKYDQALEMVRMAPSAHNKQPWRVIKTENIYHFFIYRNKPHDNTRPSDLQKVDMGIALSHFKIAVDEFALNGKWHINNPGIIDWEYVISWISE